MNDLVTTVHNERVKLTASWLNSIAVAVLAVGGFAPMISALYGGKSVGLPLVIGTLVCILAALALHYWARRSLKGLRQ